MPSTLSIISAEVKNMQKNGKPVHAAEDKGFYIILVLCIAAIAISGYVLFFAPLSGGASMESVEYTPNLPVSAEEDARTQAAAGVQEPVVDTVLPTEGAEAPEAPAEPEAPVEPAEQTSAPVWVKPVNGEVVQAFSGDNLVYQKTFGDWRVHDGADYLGASGARVYAVADGEVTEVTSDPLWGACVMLRLTDGRTATYRGLAEGPKVKKGSSVKAGDVVGSVAAVVPAEAEEGPHIHLELRDPDGVTVDPEQGAK